MLTLRLALADLARDWIHLICGAALVAGILAPLLILIGVKIGVGRTLLAEFREDPAKREIQIGGNATLPPDLVAEIADWPETGFVAPRVRSQSSDVSLAGAGRVLDATMTPSGPGDPMLGDLPAPSGLAVVLSPELARRLGAEGTVEMVALRYAPTRRALPLTLEVIGVLADGTLGGRQILADPSTMDLIEAYYDGYAVPAFEVAEGTPFEERTQAWESLRLYAASMDAVGPLEARIEARLAEAGADVNAVSAAAEIAATQRLIDNLTLALWVVIAAAGVGMFAALLSSFWAGVERKRATLSLLALQGAPPAMLAALPMVQALATASLGALLAFVVFGLGAGLAEALFADRIEGRLVALPPGAALGVALGVLAVSAAAALAASLAAQRADPAETLRGRA